MTRTISIVLLACLATLVGCGGSSTDELREQSDQIEEENEALSEVRDELYEEQEQLVEEIDQLEERAKKLRGEGLEREAFFVEERIEELRSALP